MRRYLSLGAQGLELEFGRGVVGRNYAYQTTSGVQVFYDRDTRINPFMRSGASGTVIADFICPNEVTREAFAEAFTIWVDRLSEGRFEDTNRMFVPPARFDLRVGAEGAQQYWAEQALARLRPPSIRRSRPPCFSGATSRFIPATNA